MTQTLEDLERIAYITGDTDRADLLARIAELEQEVRDLEDKISDTETLEEWEKTHGSAQEYYDFFHACFEHLGKHYPCPEVSSEYDCSVIFDAIETGEAARQENEGD